MVSSDEGLDTTEAVDITDSEDIEDLGNEVIRSCSMHFNQGGTNPS